MTIALAFFFLGLLEMFGNQTLHKRLKGVGFLGLALVFFYYPKKNSIEGYEEEIFYLILTLFGFIVSAVRLLFANHANRTLEDIHDFDD